MGAGPLRRRPQLPLGPKHDLEPLPEMGAWGGASYRYHAVAHRAGAAPASDEFTGPVIAA